MENLITIPKYAAQNRLSIHTVVKKTMNGELKTVEKEENGAKTVYIRLDDSVSDLPAPSVMAEPVEECEIDYKKAYEDLNKEYLILKTKYEKLLKGE